MKLSNAVQKSDSFSESGTTLLELIIAATILIVLSSAALPAVRFTIVRQKEAELHRDLREMRDAIDRYKDYCDRGLIRVEAGSEGYRPDLETLVKAVNIGAEQKIRFLRRIPKGASPKRDRKSTRLNSSH